MLRQLEPKRVTLCDVDFAIFPFGAIDAAKLSAELGKFLGPIVAGALPLLASDSDVMSLDLKDAMPLITGAFSSLDGEALEKLLFKLLLASGNINCSYVDETTNQRVQCKLTKELLDGIFCQNIDSLFKLAYEVINLNFAGFFEKLLGQSGSLGEVVKMRMSGSMEHLTQAPFQSLN